MRRATSKIKQPACGEPILEDQLRHLNTSLAQAVRQYRELETDHTNALTRIEVLEAEIARMKSALEELRRDTADEQNRLRLGYAGLHNSLRAINEVFLRMRSSLAGKVYRYLRGSGREEDSPVLGQLVSGRSYVQRLSGVKPGLCGVSIQIATLERVNTCTLVMELRRSPQSVEPVVKRALNANTVQDNQYHLFAFDPIETFSGSELYLTLESPDALLGNAVSAYWSRGGDGLVVDGRKRKGSLNCRLHYRDYAADAGGEPASDKGGLSVRGFCDRPALNAVSTVGSIMLVEGWAVSPNRIESVEALFNGKFVGALYYGVARPDIATCYPDMPEAKLSGFRGYVDLSGMPEGVGELTLKITDKAKKRLQIVGKVRFDRSAVSAGNTPDINSAYSAMLARRKLTSRDFDSMRLASGKLKEKPLVSIVTPVFDPDPGILLQAIESVKLQVYENWELILVDDASTDAGVKGVLSEVARDPRIKVFSLKENSGIAAATALGLDRATGSFAGFLDHDDLLHPDTLLEVVKSLNEDPGLDMIYTDEDKISADGSRRYDPFFKPDWSPDLFMSQMYTCHFSLYRTSLVREAGGVRAEFSGSQDYDLALRVTEKTDRIHHVPKVLYSWRAVARSTASSPASKEYAHKAAKKALQEALQRRKAKASVHEGIAPGRWRVKYHLKGSPKVSIIIPTGGYMKYLKPCLESVLGETDYGNFEIVLVDNSEAGDVADFVEETYGGDERVRYFEDRRKPFNFCALNNSAVGKCRSRFIVLMNDDITVITPNWVPAMLEHAARPEVGVVGAKLLYADGSIQHAGVILGIYGNCGHAFKMYPPGSRGYFDFIESVRNYSAVTFACAMIRREVYQDLSGLDDINLPVAFNDVDFCLRAQEKGFRVVYTPYASFHHHESVTKPLHVGEGEVEYMKKRWSERIVRDPYYNPNLTRRTEDFSLDFDE